MKFFFPDSQDLVDPSFDFTSERRSETRLRHRDDQYAHEVFSSPPYDGMLISKAIVEGHSGGGGRYTLAQRQRLLRCGAREFLRLPQDLKSMGDCGAFSYVQEKTPPVTVDEVIDFYEACGVDFGVSVDHIILAFQPDDIAGNENVSKEWVERQKITLELADQFIQRHKSRGCKFIPVGVAQGWNPKSYSDCVAKLQKMGYSTIGMGGMVKLKSHEIVSVLKSVSEVRAKRTNLHLFGVTRLEHLDDFSLHGVTSFDSTSALVKAFKDDKDNYYTPTRTYTAIKVPQVQGNAKLNKRIVAGEVNQQAARRLELACLESLLQYAQTRRNLGSVLKNLAEYELIHDAKRNHSEVYRETLTDRPWERCPCDVCKALGIHVIIFRGAERNRRRGFHNLFVTYSKLSYSLASRNKAKVSRLPNR